MPSREKLNFGIVGACGRGRSFKAALEANPLARIHAVCDIDADRLPAVAAELGADEIYTDYDEMLQRSDIDAVIIATPMPQHVPQAVAALRKNIHVVCEVPAGVSVEECRELVAACKASEAVYMMAENYIYLKQNVVVRELVRRGLFGQTYYAEGEYIHELKGYNEVTPWRRRWQTGVNGITYGTHSLGPILGWMPGERVVSVCCAGSGHHYLDPRGDAYENEDSCVMLCKTSSGGLEKIRVDMLSERPHATTNYQLQGTEGCYESARAPGERDRIWLAKVHGAPRRWGDLAELEEEYLPDWWRSAEELARRSGHGGGDFFEVVDFVKAITDGAPPPVGVHEAMDMTLPGLVSQQSIAQGGRWLDVPDSRGW